ncbi:MAG: hypothetical protein K9W44_16610 [Candidatus Lokiarchaeota archaeon]|nr:hypothetical protein [Candidatus Harpocratesius repetitus]
MKFLTSKNSRRGFYVLSAIVFIILFVILGSMIKNLNTFNNEKLNGDFAGTISIPNEPQYYLNITFNEEGKLNGTLQIGNDTRIFDNMEYFIIDTHVEFSIYFFDQTTSIDIVFIGDMNEQGTLLSGTVQISEGNNTPKEGSFHLAIVD